MATPAFILVAVEGEAGVSLCADLARFGMQSRAVSHVEALLTQAAQAQVDLVVLGLSARGDGLLPRLRACSGAAIIVIGDFAAVADRVVALEMGADDCLDQPVLRRELVARIHTVLRRTRTARIKPALPADLVRFDGWELRRSDRHLRSPAGRPVALSTAEFRLLDVFLQTPRRVVSRDQLMSRARDRDAVADARSSIDLLVCRLRQKLHDRADDVALIRTVRGQGYRFDVRAIDGAVIEAAS